MTYTLPFKQNEKIIELGGGQNPWFRPNLDVRAAPEVDIVADIGEKLPIKNNEYSAVFCRYAIEHISWRKVKDFIQEVFRILSPGGTAVFITADLLEQARILTEIPSFEDKWVCMVFGDNDYPENAHRCGFSPEFAGRIFKEIGFEQVTIIRHPEWRGDMIIEAKKSELTDKPEVLFDKDYFNGGGKVGGYAREGYRDFPIHWVTAKKILDMNPESVLEIGCARGYVLKKIQDAGVPVGGLEVSKHCFLTRACDNITQIDICNTPWNIPDKFFDLCYSVAVLEHIPEKYIDNVIKEIDRVSKRGIHGIDFGENDDGFDQTHCTLKDQSWWKEKFPESQIACNKEELEKLDGPLANQVPVGDNKLKLNIGSHIIMFHNGWVNIDILPLQEFARQEAYKFLQWDVKNPLPFDNDSVDLIYSSHFLEHLSYEEGKVFLKDCQRVLKKDGVMRLMVPDLELLKNKYDNETLGDFDEINDESAKCPSQAGKFWKLLFNGHSAAYDFKTLKALANELGFAAAKRNFRQGNLQILQETLDTLPCLSLYVELLKL